MGCIKLFHKKISPSAVELSDPPARPIPQADMRGAAPEPAEGLFQRLRRIFIRSLPLTPRAREGAAREVLGSIPVLEVTTPNGTKRAPDFGGPSRAAGPNVGIRRGKSSRTTGGGRGSSTEGSRKAKERAAGLSRRS